MTLTLERPLPLTPIEKRWTKIGVPSDLLRKPGTKYSSWRAFSLRPFYLSVLFCVSVCFLAACETLRQLSNRNQGLFFFEDTSEISTPLFFAYNYVPSIFAVLYVIAWSLVDLDTKRLEPYFQLAAHDTISTSILFLDYCFESSITTPFRALSRRHWTIAFISTVFLVLSLILPPLQSALIGITSANFTEDVSFQTWQQLLSLENQFQNSTTDYVKQVTPIIQSFSGLPPFVTYDYAISPFDLGYRSGLANETWTVETRVFWAEPNCQELPNKAQFHRLPYNITASGTNTTSLLYSFRSISLPADSNGDTACSLSLQYQMLFEQNQTVSIPNDVAWFNLKAPLQEQYWSPTEFAWLSNDCQTWRFFSYSFESLLISVPAEKLTLGMPGLAPTAIGAVVCEPKYFFALASVTVSASNQSVIAVNVTGPSSDLSPDFDIDAFESLLFPPLRNSGSSPIDFHDIANLAVAYLANTMEEQDPTDPGTMIYQDVDYLKALEVVYRLVFVLALLDNLNTTSDPSVLTGSTWRNLNTLATSPVFAIVSELVWAIGAIASLVTFLVYRNRQNMLRSDPDSISALCSLVADSFNELASLGSQDLDKASTQSLKNRVSGIQYRLSEEESRWKVNNLSTQGKVSESYSKRLHLSWTSTYHLSSEHCE